jgi:hypothetical protein
VGIGSSGWPVVAAVASRPDGADCAKTHAIAARINKQLRVPAFMSVMGTSLRAIKDRYKMPDDRSSGMKQPIAHAARPLSSIYPASGRGRTTLVDSFRYYRQDVAPRMTKALVEGQYVGRDPVPDLRHGIAEWIIVAALFAGAVLVTMGPFIFL